MHTHKLKTFSLYWFYDQVWPFLTLTTFYFSLFLLFSFSFSLALALSLTLAFTLLSFSAQNSLYRQSKQPSILSVHTLVPKIQHSNNYKIIIHVESRPKPELTLNSPTTKKHLPKIVLPCTNQNFWSSGLHMKEFPTKLSRTVLSTHKRIK